MISLPLPPVSPRSKKTSLPASSVIQQVNWENRIIELLTEFPKSTTEEIVVGLNPDFATQAVTERAILWREISTTLARMLVSGSVTMSVDEVHLARWFIDDISPRISERSRS